MCGKFIKVANDDHLLRGLKEARRKKFAFKVLAVSQLLEQTKAKLNRRIILGCEQKDR